MTQEEYLQFARKTCDEMLALIKRKNSDYCNGGSAFANFEKSTEFGITPLRGLCLRVEDKWQRVKSFFRNGKLEVENEGVEDAFKDLIGYSLIALGMLADEDRKKTLTGDALADQLLLEEEERQRQLQDEQEEWDTEMSKKQLNAECYAGEF